MKTIHTIVLFLLSILLPALALPTSKDTSHISQKRAYSVRPGDRPTGRTPWPIRKTDILKEDHRPVFYCFEDEKALRNLAPILQAAIRRWAVATYPQTSLTFEPHPECGPDPLHPKKFCEDLSDDSDALNISDEGPDGAPTATIGYMPDDPEHFGKHRHGLLFYGVGSRSPDQLVVDMMHELGHVVGLAHEHQRPDRDGKIKLDCRNVEGWFQAQGRMRQDPRTATMDSAVKANYLCNRPGAARHFGFTALKDYLRGPLIGGMYNEFEASGPVDLDSLMIYGSYQGRGDESTPETSSDEDGQHQPRPYNERKLSTAPLVGRARTGDFEIFQGGSRIPSQKRLSPGDIARVKQLYPKIEAAPEGQAGPSRAQG